MKKRTSHTPVWLILSLLSTVLTPLTVNANLPIERTLLPLPEVVPKTINKPTTSPQKKAAAEWLLHTVKIRKNDSLSTALDKLNISAATSYAISRLKNSRKMTHLRVGDELKIWVDKHDKLQRILYPKTQTLSYELVKTDLGYHINEKVAQVEIRTEMTMAVIQGPFYLAAKRAGLSAKSIMNLADIFAWDIDFSREIRKGDTLKVIYETRYLKGQYIGDGNILAAQITTNNGRETHNAFIVRENDDTIGYYNEKGKNLKKAFLKSPVDYVRITSRFSPKRFHPVLKKWRSHRGVDYAGPTGTPIHATGKGKIIYRGWGTGYGRYIKIQHANNYITVYGHMSRFGPFKKGSHVNQGDTIGYIGQSGLATGPHVHYEFRINNKHVDPLKIKFPDAGPMDKKYRAAFKRNAQFLLSQLNRLDHKTYLAKGFE